MSRAQVNKVGQSLQTQLGLGLSSALLASFAACSPSNEPYHPQTGGAPNGSGGNTVAGGAPSSTGGSATTTGGALGTGGSPATGGANATGGATSTSGGTSTGGSNASGGAPPSSGGAAAGNAQSGGSVSGGAAGSGAGAGGAGTAGSGGTASAGAAGSGAGAPSGCGAAGSLFCDDFESGTTVGMPPPSPKWSLALNGMGTVVIDGTTAAHSGSKSVHVSSGGGYQTFFALTGAPLFPPPSPGKLYLRLYIRLGAAMTGGHNTYYKAGAAGMSSSEHETRVGVMNGMLMINQPAGDRGFLSNQNYYNDGMKPGVVFTPMVWTCVEALFDPPNSTFDIWVEGKEVPDLHRTDWQQDTLGSFHFGFEKYAGPDADIWYDDIVVSTSPIGCG